MSEVRIHYEGDAALRPGFRQFFDEIFAVARRRRIKLRLISGGATAPGDFQNSLRSHPEAINLLIIDSEGPYSERTPPAGLGGLTDCICWMVQVMESWFLADPDARYYGQGFQPRRLRTAEDVESIAKADVLCCLKQATGSTAKGHYHKTRDAPRLLEFIDSSRVRQRSRHCDEIFSGLRARLDA